MLVCDWRVSLRGREMQEGTACTHGSAFGEHTVGKLAERALGQLPSVL